MALQTVSNIRRHAHQKEHCHSWMLWRLSNGPSSSSHWAAKLMSVHGSREKLEQLKAYWLEGSWKICLELVRRGKLRQRDTCMHVGTALPPEHLAEGDIRCHLPCRRPNHKPLIVDSQRLIPCPASATGESKERPPRDGPATRPQKQDNKWNQSYTARMVGLARGSMA